MQLHKGLHCKPSRQHLTARSRGRNALQSTDYSVLFLPWNIKVSVYKANGDWGVLWFQNERIDAADTYPPVTFLKTLSIYTSKRQIGKQGVPWHKEQWEILCPKA